MTDLPPGWIRVRLNEIAEVRLGRQRSPKNHSGSQMRPYLRAANVGWEGLKLDDVKLMNFTEEEAQVYRLRPGDIIMSEASGSPGEVGKPALWNGEIADCCFQNTLIRVRSHGPDPKFLLLLLRYEALRGAFVEHSRGVGIHHLGAARLSSWPINLPPLTEQRRIVATLEDHLSRLDSGLRLLVARRAHIPILIRSVYSAAVEGAFQLPMLIGSDFSDLDAKRMDLWKRAHPDKTCPMPTPPDISIKPFVPTGWRISSLEALTDPVRTIRYGILMPKLKNSTGVVPYVEVKDLAGGYLEGKELHKTSRELDEKFAASRLKDGDVVLAVRGSYDRSAVVPKEWTGVNVSRDVVRIAPLDGIDAEYLHAYLQSRFTQEYLKRHARGVAVKGVNTGSVRALPVVFPPVGAQRAIVAMIRQWLGGIARLSVELEHACLRAAQLRHALFAAAFSGHLVRQEPEHEPTSLMLERIRLERADAESKGRRMPHKLSKAPQRETLL